MLPGGISSKRNQSWIDDDDEYPRPRITYTDQEIVRKEMASFKSDMLQQFHHTVQQQNHQHEESLKALRAENATIRAEVRNNDAKADATFALLRTQGDTTLALLQKILEGQGPRVAPSSADL